MKSLIKPASMLLCFGLFSCFAVTAMESRMREAEPSEEEPTERASQREFERAFLGLTQEERIQFVKIFEEQKAAQRRAAFNRPQKEKGGSKRQALTRDGQSRR